MTFRIPLGPFELHRRIGKGGMGEVWEGLHVPQQVPIAVKILTHGGVRRDAFVEAFRNEVRGLAGLNHPGIVTVLDYGEMPAGAAKLSEGMFQAKSPYLVMELGHRGSLKRFVDAMGWMELKAVLFTILDALAHAHAAGVIHRDLKPANILVGCGTEHGRGIKLTDFGLAHAIDQHEFAGSTDSGWGTPQFMAPEQFRGAWRDYGPWTDLYALGVMTFYLCVGTYPYEADDAGSFARAHQLGTPAPFISRFPVPAGFDEWVARLMQKHPSDRYLYAADAAWALQKLGDPVGVPLQRDTISMIPVAAERKRWMTEDRVGATAAWRRPPKDDALTMLDQPPTTRLIEFGQQDGGSNTFDRPHGLENELAQLSESSEQVPYREAPPLPYTWHRAVPAEASPKLIGAGLGLFGLRNFPMVGREDERDRLWEVLRTVRTEGVAQAVCIRGQAGTGKTRLAQWFCRRAHEVGSAVLLKTMFSPIAGPGDGLSRMIAQQLRAGGMDVGQTMRRVEHEFRRFGVRDTAEIVAMTRFIMPLMSTSPEIEALPLRSNGPTSRYGLLLRHLQRLTEDRPVVVWFDDVQWGADALSFVQYVIERQHHTPVPVVFVMTLRDEALSERPVERGILAEITRNRRAHTIEVAPLAPQHLGQLVRELLYLAPALAAEVERTADGNPLFAVQLVGDWVAGGKLVFGPEGFQLRDGVEVAIPDDLNAMWRERLSLLLRRRSMDDRVALEIAAALGSSVELTEWYAACAAYGVSTKPDFIRDLLESGLTVQTEYGFQFCHGLFRESVERSSEDGGRAAHVHNACVQMLESLYPQQHFPFAERFAQHVVAAGESERAIGPLWQAARARTDRSEFDIALALLDARDRLLDEHDYDDDAKERSIGWTTRAQVHMWQGHYAEAHTYASKAAVEARRNGWAAIRARAVLTEGLAHLYCGELQESERDLERAHSDFESLSDNVGTGQCLHGLGRVAQGRGDFAAAERFFADARQRLVAAGDQLGEAQTLNALGDLERERGDWERAMRYSRQAREVFLALENAIGVADCVNDIAELHRLMGEYDEATAGCLDALRRYEAVGSEHSVIVRMNLALTLAARGSDPQARQLLDEARVRFEQTSQLAQLALVSIYLIPILLRLGEADLARRRFDEARPMATRFGVRGRDAKTAVEQAIELLDQLGDHDTLEQVREFAAHFR